MTGSKLNPKVDEYLNNADKWKEEQKTLRQILLSCNLTEEFKWGKPCYMVEKYIIVVMAGFKGHCVLNFIKGALLKDDTNILVQPTENSLSSRQMRFTNVEDILKNELLIKDFISQTIELEKAGAKVIITEDEQGDIIEELQVKFDEMPEFKVAFEALTKGRQRAYKMFFSAPKQSKTKTTRIEKYISQILLGKGIND